MRDTMTTTVVRAGNLFLGRAFSSGKTVWVEEYPDAATFTSRRDAMQTLNRCLPSREVLAAETVENYGSDRERTRPAFPAKTTK